MVNTAPDGLVIGLDLGDGETTLAWTTRDGGGDIQVFQRRTTGERGVLTAMARAATDRRRLLGEEAVYAAGAAEFSLNFKQAPKPRGFEIPEAVLFVQALLAEFLADRADDTGGTDGTNETDDTDETEEPDRTDQAAEPMMVVGHPAGWSPAVVDAYAGFLRMPGINTRLLPESQAALVHVRRPDSAADRSMAEQPPPERVLVVDIGSSTTDFTLITDREPRSLPLGADFGCRRIDFQVADLVTERLRGNEILGEALAADGGREFLLLACRRAKEAQFTGAQAEIINQPVNPRFLPIVELAWGWLRALEIPALVAAPGGWAEEFRALLAQARGMAGDEGPDQVVLTGGGSRMPFTRRLCAEVFPDAVVHNDPEPAFSVARGLALAGYTELRLERFRAALDALLDEPELEELSREHIADGFAELQRSLARAVRTMRDAPGSDEARARSLVEGEGEPLAVGELRTALNERLGERVSSLCREHGVPHDALDLKFQLPLSVAETLTERLVDYVKSKNTLRSGRAGWAVSQQRRMIEQQNRGPLQPGRPGNPYVEMARVAWQWGGPAILEAADRWTVRKMVKDIEALSLDEGKVDELVEKIRAHIRDQLLGRLTEIEKLIF
ncbi:Hsp70 family protein [Streptomyces sp. NPDC007808]|uniref:Hsp70 family protein n=1 Tax=Streptomyces sp. NPDC007808 TaxID=3364779 RepID=UPI00368EB730